MKLMIEKGSDEASDIPSTHSPGGTLSCWYKFALHQRDWLSEKLSLWFKVQYLLVIHCCGFVLRRLSPKFISVVWCSHVPASHP